MTQLILNGSIALPEGAFLAGRVITLNFQRGGAVT